MAKMTLLEMVQNILSATDGDDVNSISDTVESLQVAEVVRETYFELFGNTEVPEFKVLTQLTGLGDTDKPTHMQIPSEIDKVLWIKYDYQTDGNTDYRTIVYLSPTEFFDLMATRVGADNTVEVTDDSGAKFWIYNNVNPQYWTIFDDEYIVFDSYDSDLDSTLQTSKSVVFARKDYEFEMVDDFVPHLDSNLFPGFLAEAKSVCFLNQKQMPSPKEEQRSKRQRVRVQGDLWRANQRQYSGPDYGRKPR